MEWQKMNNEVRYLSTKQTAEMMEMSVENLRILAKDETMRKKGFPSPYIFGKRNWKFKEEEIKTYLTRLNG